MKNFIKPAAVLTLLMAVLIGGYTLAVYGLGKILPTHGEGEQIEINGKRAYANVAQKFSQPQYFHPRPSNVDYNAAGSGGSNKGPINPEYLADVQKRIDTLRMQNPEMAGAEIPVDLVTASSSGLDPDISAKGAEYQIKRVAKVRHMDENMLKSLIAKHTEQGVFGPSKVNVLKLNAALDNNK